MSESTERIIGVSNCSNCIFAMETPSGRIVCSVSIIGFGGSGVIFIENFIATSTMPDKCPLLTSTIKVVKND